MFHVILNKDDTNNNNNKHVIANRATVKYE